MPVQISPEDEVRCRKHLGYGNATSAQTFNGGIPAAVQTQFMVEGAMPKILPQALPEFLKLLDRLDAIECKIDESTDDLEASKVGSIDLRENHYEKLIQRYKHWRSTLGNLLMIPPNPFDFRFSGSLLGDGPMGGGINMPVSN